MVLGLCALGAVPEKDCALGLVITRMERVLVDRLHLKGYPEGFVPGEWVRLGNPASPTGSAFLRSTEETDSPFGQAGIQVTLPSVATFQRAVDEKHFEVSVPERTFGTTLTVQIAREMVTPLRVGHGGSLLRAMGVLSSPKLEFANGEPVRYRDGTSGRMGEAKFVSIKRRENGGGKQFVLQGAQGEFLSHRSLVFRSGVDGGPETPELSIDSDAYLWPTFEARAQGEVFLFLNGAARVSSHPDYPALDPLGRIKVLAAYTRALVPPDPAAVWAEHLGLYTFDHIVRAGVGVCRHISTLLGAALMEAGFRVRMLFYAPPSQREGHVWLEVDARDGGSVVTYVVDATHGVYDTLESVLARAPLNQRSFEARYYSQAERIVLPFGPQR